VDEDVAAQCQVLAAHLLATAERHLSPPDRQPEVNSSRPETRSRISSTHSTRANQTNADYSAPRQSHVRWRTWRSH
jgi:hypothetical protein